MKLTDYLRTTLPSLLSQFVMVLVIDAILLTGTNLEKSLRDILYLNVLMLAIWAVFLLYGYIKAGRTYAKIRKALDDKRSIDYLLPEDESFHSSLLRDVVQAKFTEQTELVGKYKSDMDELNNYITKWVHEVKIPISVSELMLENTDDIGIEASRKFKAEMERIKFLVNQVLYAGRAAYYQEDLSVSEFNLQKAIREALKLNSYFLMAKNIEVIPGKLDFEVVSDEKWIIYILEQILNNASKYVRPDGRIEIFADADDKMVRLYLKDNGIGIPLSDISRVFDKGFTGENGRRTSKSTGMGLYYSKKIAGRLGIGLEVRSVPEEFTEFVLTFYKLSDYLNVTKI